jgi:hypothetical protein
MQHRVCQRTTSSCFNEAGLPLRAVPYKENGLVSKDTIVLRVPYTDENTDCLVDEYWYGIVGQNTKEGRWIKFIDLEDNSTISWEKHFLHLADYYDKWMLVEEK